RRRACRRPRVRRAAQRRRDGDFPLSAVAQPFAAVCPPERALTQPLAAAPWPERAVAHPLAPAEPAWPCASPASAHALLPPLDERPLEARWLVSESRTFRAVVALLAPAAETLLPTPWGGQFAQRLRLRGPLQEKG